MKKKILLLLISACLFAFTGCDFNFSQKEKSNEPAYTGDVVIPEDTGSKYVPQETTTLEEGEPIDYITAALSAVGVGDSLEEKAQISVMANIYLPIFTTSGVSDDKIKSLCEYVINNGSAIALVVMESETKDTLTPNLVNTAKQVYNDVMTIVGRDTLCKLFYNASIFGIDLLITQSPLLGSYLAIVKNLIISIGVDSFSEVNEVMINSFDKAINFVSAEGLLVVLTILGQENPSNEDLAYVVNYYKVLLKTISLTQSDVNKIIDNTIGKTKVKEQIKSLITPLLADMPEDASVAINDMVNSLFTTITTTTKATSISLQNFSIALLDQIDAKFIGELKTKVEVIDNEFYKSTSSFEDFDSMEENASAQLDLIKFILRSLFKAYDSLSNVDRTAIITGVDALSLYLESNKDNFDKFLTSFNMNVFDDEAIAHLIGEKTNDVNSEQLIEALRTFANNDDNVETLLPTVINYVYTKFPNTLKYIMTMFFASTANQVEK